MKICHIITGLGTGGAERMLLKLVAALPAPEFRHTVIALMDEGTMAGPLRAAGADVYALGLGRGRSSPLAILRLRRLIRSVAPDLLQGWMYHGNIAALAARAVAPSRPRLIWNVRHSLHDLSKEKRGTAWMIRLGALLSRLPDRIIYNSVVAADQHERLGYANSRRCILPNGFDTELFRPDSAAGDSVRRELQIPHDAPLVGMVARYHPMKDHETFLRAAAIAGSSWPEAHFVLVGREVDCSNAALRPLARSLGLEGRVHMLGERPDIGGIINACVCITLCSAWGEGFPNVIGEAMSCGVPCVVTDVGDASAIIGETGIVVPTRAPEALAAAWHKLLDEAPEVHQHRAAAARQRILDCYSLVAIADRYAQLYRSVSSESTAPATGRAG